MIKEIAKKLHDLSYRFDEKPLKDLFQQARDNDILIVFGASDDLCELRGVFDEELDAWDGRDYTKPYDYLDNDDGDEDIIKLKKALKEIELKAFWCGKILETTETTGLEVDKDISFVFSVKDGIRSENFTLLEDDEVYCIGKVIDLKSISKMEKIIKISAVFKLKDKDGVGLMVETTMTYDAEKASIEKASIEKATKLDTYNTLKKLVEHQVGEDVIVLDASADEVKKHYEQE